MAHSRFAGLLRNSSFILLLAIVLGLTSGIGASRMEAAVTPLLGLIMTLSVIDISAGTFLNFRKILPATLIGQVLNYGALSGTIIGLSYLLIDDESVHTGLVLVAAVPPAIAVIPFTTHLKGNTVLSLVSVITGYLAALAITPLICIAVLGTSFIEPSRLLVTLAELILAPIILSQVLRRTPAAPTLMKWRGTLVNWGFFGVIYTLISLNRDQILHDPGSLLGILAIAFVCTFVLSEVINLGFKLARFDRADRISFLLIGTRKTYGLAGAIALAFFDARAGIPPAAMSAVAIVHFVWLTWRVRRLK